MGWFGAKSPLLHWPGEVPTFREVGIRPASQSSLRETSEQAVLSPQSSLSDHLAFWQSQNIRADRHCSPDFLGQIKLACERPIDTVLCSALDDEFGLRLNAAVAARRAAEVVGGVRLLSRLCGANHAMIAIEGDGPDWWDRPVRGAAKERKEGGIAVVELPNHYPQADPTLLLYTLTGRRLVPGKLPVERGVLLLDAMAAAAVGRGEMGAVAVGVLDHDSRRAHYLEVARGMSLREAMSAAGISGEGKDIFGGDWRRGRRMTADSKMDGGELAIHLFGKRQHVEAAACTRCGWCLTVCPTLVSPALALEAAQRGDAEMALRAGTGACIECGLCDQACPSNLPLLEGIRKMKL